MFRTLRILSKINKQLKSDNQKIIVDRKPNDKKSKVLPTIRTRINNYPVDIDKINNKDIFLL